MSMLRLKPVNPDAIIRDPFTKQPLSATGGEVPDNSYWRRRLIAGEVVELAEGDLTAAEHSAKEQAQSTKAPTGREPVAPLTTRGDK